MAEHSRVLSSWARALSTGGSPPARGSARHRPSVAWGSLLSLDGASWAPPPTAGPARAGPPSAVPRRNAAGWRLVGNYFPAPNKYLVNGVYGGIERTTPRSVAREPAPRGDVPIPRPSIPLHESKEPRDPAPSPFRPPPSRPPRAARCRGAQQDPGVTAATSAGARERADGPARRSGRAAERFASVSPASGATRLAAGNYFRQSTACVVNGGIERTI
jgi:hypothetical protein